MSETSLVSITATVLTYSNENKKWILVGTSEGQSKVQLYHNTAANKYRIVAWKLADREVVLNYPLTANLRYHEASKTFHQWKSGNQVYGLSFASEDEAVKFATCTKTALQELVTPNYDFPPPAPTTNRAPSPQLPKRGVPLNVQATVTNSPLNSPSTPPTNLLPCALTIKPSVQPPVSPLNSPSPPSSPPDPPISSPPPNVQKPPGNSAPAPPSGAPPPPGPPPPPPSGGPPPPPPPPSGGGPPKPPSAGGGLAAALQGKKLRKADDGDSKESSASIGGKMSMMDEMAARLKRRKEQGTDNSPKLDIPENKQRPVSPPKPSSPLPASQPKIENKPATFRKPSTGIAPKINPSASQLSPDQLQNLKKDILEEIRKEFRTLKEELLKELKQ